MYCFCLDWWICFDFFCHLVILLCCRKKSADPTYYTSQGIITGRKETFTAIDGRSTPTGLESASTVSHECKLPFTPDSSTAAAVHVWYMQTVFSELTFFHILFTSDQLGNLVKELDHFYMISVRQMKRMEGIWIDNYFIV